MADAGLGGQDPATAPPTSAAPEDLRGVVDESVHERGGPAVRAAARIVDAHVTQRCLVHGSLPDEARDLDLLVEPPTATALDVTLPDAGFERRGADWVLIDGGAAAALSLTLTSEWALAPSITDALFAEARPVPGTAHLAQPAPHHDLLVLARRLAVHPGELGERHRSRIDAATRDDPEAWSGARAAAGEWGCARALRVLARANEHEGVVRRRDALVARFEQRRSSGQATPRAALGSVASLTPRPFARFRARRARGAVVALSGIDGAGKSTQAQLVSEALWALGYDTVIEWSRITFEASLDRIARPVKSLLALRSRRSRPNPESPRAEPSAEPDDPVRGDARALRQRSRLVGGLWAGVVAGVHAWTLRRATLRHLRAGRVVVRDRYLLDSIVQLDWAYADGRELRWQSRLIRMLVPRPSAAFFLDLDPEGAHGRKPEEFDVEQLRRHRATYTRQIAELDVTVVDGARPRDEVFACLLRGTLDRLGPAGS